jgi:hypothetical protein
MLKVALPTYRRPRTLFLLPKHQSPCLLLRALSVQGIKLCLNQLCNLETSYKQKCATQ